MKITIEHDNVNIKKIDNRVTIITTTPHDNWVNELAEKAEAIVNSFHYDGRDPERFSDDMGQKHFRNKLWNQIVELAAALKDKH